MNLKNKFNDRYKIIFLVLYILMFILIVRLFYLTVIKGDEFREKSDTTRLREIPITAARGEIRDRKGRLLAGNRMNFTVQLIKSELDTKETEKKNKEILDLIRLLEEDGVNYLDEFPIKLNTFKYVSESDYLSEEKSPEEKVIKLIKENNLLGELLIRNYRNDLYGEHFKVSMLDKAVQIVSNKGLEVPLYTQEVDGNPQVYFKESQDIQEWKNENKIDQNASAFESLLTLFRNSDTYLRELLNHSISRKLAYDILQEKALTSNITLEDFSLVYDESISEQKRNLSQKYDFISKDSSGEEDFLNIFKKESLENFLERPFTRKNFRGKEVFYSPAESLVKELRKKDKSLKFKIEINDDEGLVKYIYTGKNDIKDKSGLEYLIENAIKYDLLDDFLKDDSVRPLAQIQLLDDGINPRITITDGYEYTFIRDKENLYKNQKIDLSSTAEEAFDKIRANLKIDPNLSKYEARGIMVINYIIKNSNTSSYQPINLAYGVKDTTVARIEEGMSYVPGIRVSKEPVRFYPEGETAAHILGYLGKISQQEEIDRYIKELGYSANELIGKTGIEHSFEEQLRGKDGKKTVEVDALGNITNEISEQPPEPGNNIYLSIDLDLQKKAEESLEYTLRTVRSGGTYQSQWGNYKMATKGGRAYRNASSGSSVAVDVNNGEVLAMANYPSYDPNLFATGISTSDWESLFPENEEDLLAPRPLYNIATQTAVQPGSVYKMATALAAMDKGLSPSQQIRDGGYVKIGTDEFSCHARASGGHGLVDVEKSLEVSCNYYYYSLALGMDQRSGVDLGVKLSIDDIIDMSTQLGLNDKTGIEIKIPSENSGGVPNPERKEQGMRNMLRGFLRSNLNSYTINNQTLNPEELENIIEEIVSWTEFEEVLTKGEVVSKLRELGIDGERRLTGSREDLADSIKYTYLNQASWSLADTVNVTIGQGYGEYTPIQMANFVATLTNGGYRNKLTLVNNIKNYNNSKIEYRPELERERIDLSDYSYLDNIKKGMLDVSIGRYGTSRRTFSNFPINVGSKTGTAEKDGRNPITNEKYDNFAWFVGFGPYESPEISVATVLFQGGSGGNAGPMTRDIIGEYLGLNREVKEDQLPYENRLTY